MCPHPSATTFAGSRSRDSRQTVQVVLASTCRPVRVSTWRSSCSAAAPPSPAPAASVAWSLTACAKPLLWSLLRAADVGASTAGAPINGAPSACEQFTRFVSTDCSTRGSPDRLQMPPPDGLHQSQSMHVLLRRYARSAYKLLAVDASYDA